MGCGSVPQGDEDANLEDDGGEWDAHSAAHGDEDEDEDWDIPMLNLGG